VEDEPKTSYAVIVVLLIAVVVIIVGFVLLYDLRPQPVEIVINPPLPTATTEPTPTPGPVLVYVTGAVVHAGTTLEIPAGSRVDDVLDAAGGITEEADLERVNLAAIVRDGDHVHVPALGADDDLILPTPSGGDFVFVNTATSEELQSLPGIGPALAQRIIDYRQEYGPFTELADLEEVSGIGPTLLEGLEGLVAFD
jgi:competence protein ComEA